jgi:hypothetical protein
VVLSLAPVVASQPPGFYRDESNIAFTAATVAASGRDQHGALLPLYFSALGDWKSAPYIYLLSAVFIVTGPSEVAARALSAAVGLGAVILLGLVGVRVTGRRSVGLATAALAAATPWLFEVTRLVFEVSLEPLLLAAFVYLLSGDRNRARWPVTTCIGLGLLLALVNYTYAAGRGLAALLALGLVVFAGRVRWTSLLMVWVTFGLALVPTWLFERRHPGALFVRYHSVSATDGKSLPDAAATILANIFHDANLWRWTTSGDGNLRHHAQGTGSLLLAGVALAVIGVVVVSVRRRWDPFWAYAVLGAGVAVVPGAVTVERIHSLRLFALPVFLVVLAIPAIDVVAAHSSSALVRVAGACLLAAGVTQFALFQLDFWRDGDDPNRRDAFHAAFPGVLRAATATRRPVVIYQNDYEALGDGQWYGLLWNLPIRYVPAGRPPPPGVVVVRGLPICAACRVVARGGSFTAVVSRP